MNAPAAVFLFAHQDDEFGVFHSIASERQWGRRVFCIYLTDGGKYSARRNAESLTVLAKFGIQQSDILFVGAQLAIPDSQLPEHLDRAASWLRCWLSGLAQIAAIYIPAWEGGHQDHDALHAITVATAAKMRILNRVRQFPLYNSARCIGPFFRVLSPLVANGPVESASVSWGNRYKFLGYCLSYPSQKITWLGIFPFVVLHYLIEGTQLVQAVSEQRIRQRPHAGPLYYERRRFYTWERLCDRLADFGVQNPGSADR